MTIELALEYIPRRMKELGYGSRYYLRFRHLILQGEEKVKLPAYNQLFLLAEQAEDVRITSDFGIYDPDSEDINELQYEHQGEIQIENLSDDPIQLRFIQVIPKHLKRQTKDGKRNQAGTIQAGNTGNDQTLPAAEDR